MGETDYNALPIILLSAKDNAAASFMISEIIDNDVTESYKEKEGDVVQDHVWRIVNKYYTADVRLRACGDQQLPVGDEPVDAHIIYLQEDECCVSTCARRAAAGGAGGGAGVRLVLSALQPGALRAWCAGARYELAPLAAAPGEDGADAGSARARAALHAHVWRGLVRTDRKDASGCLDNDSDSDGESSTASVGSETDVERAELFAAALAALPGAAAGARDVTIGDVTREARLARAELLLAEFCRALGLDLDRC